MGLAALAGLLGVLLLAIVVQDAFEVMLLPRRVQRRLRLVALYYRLTWAACSRLARRLSPGQWRESLLSHFGPLSMLGLFASWATVLICGFGLLEWALEPPDQHSPLFDQVYMSGVTFFTLGYGDVVPHSGAARVVAVLEAGTGIGFIAIVIGYLPVLYQLFARREAHVIQLDARAGSPPTAVAMLCRHAEGDGLRKLDELLREWEIWGAELLESHLSYPMLAYYRSQHENQSWLAAVAAVMDCCALILVGIAGVSRLQARMTFSMTRQVVVEMAHSFGIAPSRYDGGDRLGSENFALMQEAFCDTGLTWEGDADAESTLLALRATYEPLVDGLGRHLLLEVPGWLPDPGAADHWERGHRGLIARRLIDHLTDPAAAPVSAADDGTRSWRKLRRRLQAK